MDPRTRQDDEEAIEIGDLVARSAEGDRDWVLFEHVLMLMRPDGEGGQERLLAALATCPDAACPCPEVDLLVLPVADDLARDLLAGGELPRDRLEFAGATIDLETGVVRPQADQGKPASDEVLAWIRDELDGELLDRLWEVRCRLKDVVPEVDTSELFEGDPVFCDQVFPDLRPDVYVLDGHRYWVEDVHCVEPDCDCEYLSLDISEEVEADDPDQAFRWLGAIEVERDGSPGDRTGPPEHAATVDRVWEAIRARHDVVTRYRERRRRLLLLRGDEPAAPLPAPPPPVARAAPRVGRNEPCPCGSGKKFKKCCAG